MTASGFLLALAISREGSSRKSPFNTIRSAWDMTLATEGAGSKVWEFTPSGTIPSRRILGPPMFSTKLVIGEMVDTTRSMSALRDWESSLSPELEQATRARAATKSMAEIEDVFTTANGGWDAGLSLYLQVAAWPFSVPTLILRNTVSRARARRSAVHAPAKDGDVIDVCLEAVVVQYLRSETSHVGMIQLGKVAAVAANQVMMPVLAQPFVDRLAAHIGFGDQTELLEDAQCPIDRRCVDIWVGLADAVEYFCRSHVTVRMSDGREDQDTLRSQPVPGVAEGLDGVVFAAHRFCK